jgi:hypothetical protein
MRRRHDDQMEKCQRHRLNRCPWVKRGCIGSLLMQKRLELEKPKGFQHRLNRRCVNACIGAMTQAKAGVADRRATASMQVQSDRLNRRL